MDRLKFNKEKDNLLRRMDGLLARLCVSDDKIELKKKRVHAILCIEELFILNEARIDNDLFNLKG